MPKNINKFVEFAELLADDPSDESINAFCQMLGIKPQMWGDEPHDMNYIATYENMAKALVSKYLMQKDE